MICSIETCDREASSRGWCSSHYNRWRRYGDPLGGVKQSTLEWIYAHAAFSGDECLIWPFAKADGRPQTCVDGKQTSGTRIMCTVAHGNPPTPKHHAAHECGNGHLGCISPRHLQWKTAKENAADKVFHGTNLIGERHPMVKLTEVQVHEIRSRLRDGEVGRRIAEHFAISPATVSAIKVGRLWSNAH